MAPQTTPTATRHDVLQWLKKGDFTVKNQKVYTADGRELTQRVNTRRGMEGGDARVDLWKDGKRRSMHVSHLVWMSETLEVIPDGYEIHHDDEDITNNGWRNLYCLHKLDHYKKHHSTESETPF